MKRNLPPFAAVRAFEAAARHGSFKAAAEELHVTPSSISHQVKGLEDFLGIALFDRRAGGVSLTRSGASYFGNTTCILDDLDRATQDIAGTEAGGPLSVRATPAFASRWLLPRLDTFSRAFPEIEVEITTTDDPIEFPGDGVDVLIQYGHVPQEGMAVEPFLVSTRFPVCSPTYFEAAPAIHNPQDLTRLTLLRDLDAYDEWETWFACAEAALPGRLRGPRFAHCELTLRAAEEGHGVALAYGALIDRELADGRLIKLWDLETPPQVIYSLACPESWNNRPRISAFRNWVFQQVSGATTLRPH